MVTLCLTNFNRTQLLFDSFRDVVTDPRISEIVIVDDHSTQENYNTVAWFCKDIDKVKLYRNQVNLDCYRNKREAVSKASNEYVILFDSDNFLPRSYVDRLTELKVTPGQICQPVFARPHFDFQKYSGLVISRQNVAQYMEDSTFQTMLNAMNYFVHRDTYLSVWDGSVDPVTSDSIYQNYRWLQAGHSIFVVPGMQYEHNVHEGSHYRQNVRRTPSGFHDEVVRKLKALR